MFKFFLIIVKVIDENDNIAQGYSLKNLRYHYERKFLSLSIFKHLLLLSEILLINNFFN